ncbi:MAG: alpha/beta hydrolase [Deltaproteobacteria bacterium]|nr:MAG: alpha/beta hydrolase [Deltaproteobacteria bacterium]
MDDDGRPLRYAYLHGFASSPKATKGVALAKAFRDRGHDFELPDLNQPAFEGLSHDACLGALDAMHRNRAADDGARWCLIGSSLGGWLAARWAEMHPARVERLVLLCPGFDLRDRWPAMLGSEKMAKWGSEGELYMPDASGVYAPVHYGFYIESLRQPGRPSVPCPTLIIHGTRDETVPIETSRSYVADHPGIELIEVDDDHRLGASIDRITWEALSFFGLVDPAIDGA